MKSIILSGALTLAGTEERFSSFEDFFVAPFSSEEDLRFTFFPVVFSNFCTASFVFIRLAFSSLCDALAFRFFDTLGCTGSTFLAPDAGPYEAIIITSSSQSDRATSTCLAMLEDFVSSSLSETNITSGLFSVSLSAPNKSMLVGRDACFSPSHVTEIFCSEMTGVISAVFAAEKADAKFRVPIFSVSTISSNFAWFGSFSVWVRRVTSVFVQFAGLEHPSGLVSLFLYSCAFASSILISSFPSDTIRKELLPPLSPSAVSSSSEKRLYLKCYSRCCSKQWQTNTGMQCKSFRLLLHWRTLLSRSYHT